MDELHKSLRETSRSKRSVRLGGMALLLALATAMLPVAGLAAAGEALLGTSVLGSLGVYWMFIKG